jgi:hypothetical protein
VVSSARNRALLRIDPATGRVRRRRALDATAGSPVQPLGGVRPVGPARAHEPWARPGRMPIVGR